MNFDEIRQAIDDVIAENGDNQITAKSLNLLLNNLVDTIEANAGNSGNNIMICMGDTHTIGEATDDEDIIGYITVTKEENLQKNIDAYNKIKECVEKTIPFSVILDMYQIAKLHEGSTGYTAYHYIPSFILGVDRKVIGEAFGDIFTEWGYDPTIYANDIVYQIFKGDPNDADSLILCPDGVVIGVRT